MQLTKSPVSVTATTIGAELERAKKWACSGGKWV
jgi:hypothetical protein